MGSTEWQMIVTILTGVTAIVSALLAGMAKILDDRVSRKILENNDVLLQRINSMYVRPQALADAVELIGTKLAASVEKRDIYCMFEKARLDRIEKKLEMS